MSLFLLSFFLVYGSLHAYALLKARSALALGPGATLALLLLLAVLLCAPIVTWRLGHQGHEVAARVVAHAGYLWMGFLFFLVCLNLCADLLRLALRAMGSGGIAANASCEARGTDPRSSASSGSPSRCRRTRSSEASRIEVVRVRIVTDRLPASVPSLRIAQITDLHLGLVHRNGKAREVAAIVAREHPDIFVSTGDFVDGQLDGIAGLAEILRGIPAPRGKFAVLGNHEYYAGIDRAIAFTRKAGFTLLRDESVTIDDAVRIAGVDDPAGDAVRQDRRDLRGRPPRGSPGRTIHAPPQAPPSTGPGHGGKIRPATLGTYPPRADLPVPPPYPAGLPPPRGRPPRPRGRDPACEPGNRNVGAPDAVPRPPGGHRCGDRALRSSRLLRKGPLPSRCIAGHR